MGVERQWLVGEVVRCKIEMLALSKNNYSYENTTDVLAMFT